MDPRLERLQQQIATALEFPTELLHEQPNGKWSAVEVFEHLYLTYTGTIKGFERVLAAGRPLATTATLKQRVQALVVVGFGYLPSGREAPAHARPRGIPAEKVLTEISSKIAEMDAIMARCETRFGSGARLLDHPFLGPFTAAQWRKFHLVHGLHHMKQIYRIRQAVSQKTNHQ